MARGLASDITYAYAKDHGFLFKSGSPLGSGAWLNYWFDPSMETPELHDSLTQSYARARE